MRKIFYYIYFISIFFNMPCFAHHGADGTFSQNSGLAGPIITIPAFTLPKNIKYFGLGVDYINSDVPTIYDVRDHNHAHGYRNLFIPVAYAGIGLNDKVTLSTSIPYIFKFGVMTVGHDNVVNSGNSIGVGDITLLSKYRFLKNDKHDFQSALIAGINIPSGVRRERNRQGELFEPDEQPASGSWDPILGLAVSKKIKSIYLSSNFLYKISTKGGQNSILGDVVNYNLAGTYRIREKSLLNKIFKSHLLKNDFTWDLILEGNGRRTEKTKFQGIYEENHGGTLIYLTPGIRASINKNWIFNFACGLPVIYSLNGVQRAPNIRLVFGLTRTF